MQRLCCELMGRARHALKEETIMWRTESLKSSALALQAVARPGGKKMSS